jgi:phosphatidylinositol glycan class A protein
MVVCLSKLQFVCSGIISKFITISANVSVYFFSKENTILRAKLNPSIISVIPNAIDSHQFTPDPHPQTNTSKITIVIVSRLVFRKGTDLLGGIIPIICSKHPDVHFLIGGDGPKRILLEEIREKHFLQDRVKLSDGMVPHNLVRDLLIQGNIFLNTSTTESFCIAMLEAACCGLQVVSTNVGGIPEVLPPGMVYLADPTVHCLVEKLEVAIKAHREGTAISPLEKHKLIKDLYTWSSVADRTEMIYNRLTYRPHTLLSQKLLKYYSRDESILVGTVYVMVMVLLVMIHYILDWLRPSNLIDKVPPGIHKEMINKKKK